MKKLLLALALLSATLAVTAPGAPARGTTTAPGYNFYIGVYITGRGVTLSRSVGKRGWLAHFIVHNRDTKPHRFEVGGLRTKLIAPGKKVRLGAYLDTRGQYAFKVDNKLRGYFTVV
jgi:hypothetical protein